MKTKNERPSLRSVMAADLTIGAVCIALCVLCCYLTAFRGSLWAVIAGVFAAAVGCSRLEEYTRLRRYLKWRKTHF